MKLLFSRMYLVVLIFGWMGLFFLGSTREYALQAFSFGDFSFAFYDDFPPLPGKSTFLFQILSLVILVGLYPVVSSTKWFQRHLKIITTLYFLGGVCILIEWATVLGVFLVIFFASYPWDQEEEKSKTVRYLVFALFIVSLLLRIEKLRNVAFIPLQVDSQGFLTLAQSQTWLYDTHHREPFLCWIFWLLIQVFPLPENLHIHGYLPARVFTVILSAFTIVAAFEFGKQFFSQRIAFITAVLMALNKGLIYRSLQGLRLELFILMLFVVIWLALWKRNENRSWLSACLLGIAAGLFLLIRTSGIPIILFLFLWAWWSGVRSLRECNIAFILILTITCPYYFYCWQKFGDPLFSGTGHIRFYYQAVFGEGSLQGHSISASEIMFSVYTWYQSLAFSIEGLLDTLIGRYALRLFYVPASPLLIGSTIVGYWLWIREHQKRGFFILTLLLIGPMAFFIGMLNHSAEVFDWRLVAHLIPFMGYAGAEGFLSLVSNAFFSRETGS